MTRENLNEILQNRQEEYQRRRERTAQIDLKVAKELLKDEVVIRIAHVIPCDPRTVQRAIKRLRAFSRECPIEEIDLRFVKPCIDESVYLFPSTKASLLGFRVIYELIALHQLGHDTLIRSRNFVGKNEFFEPYDSLRFMFEDKSDDDRVIYDNLASLGADFEKAYRRILLADALFTNTDRHMCNFGVIRSSKTGEILRLAPNFDNNQVYRANPGGRFSDGMLRAFKASLGLTQDDVSDLNTLIETCKRNKYLAASVEIGERFLNN